MSPRDVDTPYWRKLNFHDVVDSPLILKWVMRGGEPYLKIYTPSKAPIAIAGKDVDEFVRTLQSFATSGPL